MPSRSAPLWLAWLAACQGFAAPRPATLAALRPLPLAAAATAPLELASDGPWLPGVYDALVVRDGDTVRLQLFPDIGGKVLDLRAAPDGVWAWLGGAELRIAPPFAAAAPHPALALALLAAELSAPLDAARVLGERVTTSGSELRLRPALGAGEVVATLGADGAVAGYAIRCGGVAVVLQGDGSFDLGFTRGRLAAGGR